MKVFVLVGDFGEDAGREGVDDRQQEDDGGREVEWIGCDAGFERGHEPALLDGRIFFRRDGKGGVLSAAIRQHREMRLEILRLAKDGERGAGQREKEEEELHGAGRADFLVAGPAYGKANLETLRAASP